MELSPPAKDPFKQVGTSLGRPDFQLSVSRDMGDNFNGLAYLDINGANHRKVRPVKAIGDTKQCRQDADSALQSRRQLVKPLVLAVRDRASMEARDIGHHEDLFTGKTTQLTMGNQIVGMLMVLAFMDEIADIMQDRSVLQQIALALAQFVETSGLVE